MAKSSAVAEKGDGGSDAVSQITSQGNLHLTRSAWVLKTLDDSFSGSLGESFESSVQHSARDDLLSTQSSSDPLTLRAKADQKLMKTCKNGSDESMLSMHAPRPTSLGSNRGSAASFLGDSSDSSDSIADADHKDTAQASGYRHNDGGEVSFRNFCCELEDSDSSYSENGLLEEAGAYTDILQLSFSTGCTLSNLKSRPDDSNTTEASPKVPRSSSFNEKIPGNQDGSRKDSNIS